MMEEIAPNISDASLSIYDSLVADSVQMVAEMMGADASLNADQAVEEFRTDLGAKVLTWRSSSSRDRLPCGEKKARQPVCTDMRTSHRMNG